MSVEELFDVLELAIKKGHAEARIMFDTEAKTFNYHMAEVGSAYLEEEYPGGAAITLHEVR